MCVCVGGGGVRGSDNVFLFVYIVIDAGEAIGPKGGPIASRERSVPYFLRNPIASCDFPGRGSGPPVTPLHLIRACYTIFICSCRIKR